MIESIRSTYILPKDMLAYEKGTVLVDVPLREARDMECNRCGDCCDSSGENVKLDKKHSVPLFVWGGNLPEDRYKSRFGKEMVIPLVRGDGGLVEAEEFEIQSNGEPHRAFRCTFLERDEEGLSSCGIYDQPSPERRPLNCGSFPVFGQEVDDAIIDHGYFIPPTGALPRCTWYGMRIVGPWKETKNWNMLFENQRRIW